MERRDSLRGEGEVIRAVVQPLFRLGVGNEDAPLLGGDGCGAVVEFRRAESPRSSPMVTAGKDVLLSRE